MSKRLVFLSVVPSPYQRDVFLAIERRRHLPLDVHYLERTPHDTPWTPPKLAPWEHVLPGWTLRWQGGRSHVNWPLPQPKPGDFWVVNGAMTDVTTQLVMRRLGSRFRWAFWGELPSQPAGPFRRWLRRRQYAPLRHAQLVAAVGARAAATYRQLLPGVRVENRPYACDVSAFSRASRTTHDEVVILFCGQMIARKGIDLLLHAFADLVRNDLPVRLLLVGREAGLASLLFAQPDQVKARITHVPFQQPDTLPALFAQADVFVLPSRHDGWGVVVNQALGSGLPVVVSDAAGASELIDNDRNGLVIPAGQQAALTDALRRLIVDQKLRLRLGAGAAQSASALSPEHAADFWEKIALEPRTRA